MKNKMVFFIILILNIAILALPLPAQGNDKVYSITLNYKKQLFAEAITLMDMRLTTGTPFNYSGAADSPRLDMISIDGQVLSSIKFNIPTLSNLFPGVSNQQEQANEDLNFTLYVPYFDNVKMISIYDKNNIQMLGIPVISGFQAQPDFQASIYIDETGINYSAWLFVILPVLLVLGFLAYVEIKRKKEHIELMQKIRQQNMLELRNYVIINLRRGFGKEQIRQALLQNKYTQQEIEEAFKGIK
ncbi:hypothetical protein HYY71_04380 [Candidatus Woesearchaeota archaeon]|nr:hypothetical protein [Candidatus Woesearchaeota archaeon]